MLYLLCWLLSVGCFVAGGGAGPFVQACDNACQIQKGTLAINHRAASGEREYRNTRERHLRGAPICFLISLEEVYTYTILKRFSCCSVYFTHRTKHDADDIDHIDLLNFVFLRDCLSLASQSSNFHITC